MRRLWLIFAQTVTICLGVVFLLGVLQPQWWPWGQQRAAAAGAPRAAAVAGAPASYAAAVARAAPAVVNIYTSKQVAVPRIQLPGDPGLEQLLRSLPGFMRQERSNSLGSGVIVRPDGVVLTNYHVVDAADAIEVRLQDGRRAAARLLGADPDSDLAVLQLDLRALPAAVFEPDSAPQVGDVVLAIGNPFGVGQTTTQGIVSALGRDRLGINTYEDFIQTDAAINPGNSGGALINTAGELLGINTAIYSQSGGSLGIGFAIPAAAAYQILDQILQYGRVRRGWLGLETQDLSPELARAFGSSDLRGAIVARIQPGGPGAKARVQVGDVILSLGERPVADAHDLTRQLAALAPGSQSVLRVLRRGQPLELAVRIGERPARK